MGTKFFKAATLSLLLSCVGVEAGFAQALERNEGVRDRTRPEYIALGVLARPFIIYPTANLSAHYNSNVFASESNEVDDVVTVVKAGILAETISQRHALYFNANAKYDIYADRSDENSGDYTSEIGGRIDFTRRSRVNAKAYYHFLTATRGDVNVQGQRNVDPIEYHVVGSDASWTYDIFPATLRFAASVKSEDYENGTLVGGGVSLQDQRDKVSAVFSAGTAFRISPDSRFFVNLAGGMKDFDLGISDIGIDRDSTGFRAATGFEFKAGSLAQGSIAVGFATQQYDDDPNLDDNSIFDFKIGLTMFPTELATLYFDAGREIRDASTVGVSSYVATDLRAKADFEVARNVIVSSRVGFELLEYDSILEDENRYNIGVWSDIMFTRNVGMTVGYDFYSQDTDNVNRSYDQHRVSAHLNFQL